MKKIALLAFMVTFAASIEATIIPLIKMSIGVASLGVSYGSAQAANACGTISSDIAKKENPGAVAMATLPAMGAIGFWSCSIFSGALGTLLLYQGIKAFIKK